MFRPIDEKPIHPKNGDKYRNNDGTFEMRYGRWVKINNEVQEKYCKKCGTEYIYSHLLQCLQCPKCTPEKLRPKIHQMILEKKI